MKRNTPEDTEFYYSLIKKNSSSRQLFAESKAKYEEIQYKEAAKNLSKFKFKDIEDKKTSLEQFKGKYIFMKVWTSFCKPCIQDLKELDNLRKKHSKDKIEFIGVSVDKLEKFETWQEVVTSNGIKIPQLFFNDSRQLFFETYDISQIPAFIILSKKGIPIDINIKNFNTKKVDNIIRDLLKHN